MTGPMPTIVANGRSVRIRYFSISSKRWSARSIRRKTQFFCLSGRPNARAMRENESGKSIWLMPLPEIVPTLFGGAKRTGETRDHPGASSRIERSGPAARRNRANAGSCAAVRTGKSAPDTKPIRDTPRLPGMDSGRSEIIVCNDIIARGAPWTSSARVSR